MKIIGIKLTAAALAAAMIFSLTGCGSSSAGTAASDEADATAIAAAV